VDGILDGKCPNCGGELLVRPRRLLNKLAKNPAVKTRTHKPAGCTGAASALPTPPLAPMLPAMLTALLAALLALSARPTLAANTLPSSHAKLVQPSSNGEAKKERQAVVKLHAQTVATPGQHPGKTVGGNRLPHARTIVTKRILPP
jgi:hypothetical protein